MKCALCRKEDERGCKKRDKKDIRKKRKKRKETERQKRSRDRERRYEKRYYRERRKVNCGQFLGTVTQASKAKDEAASLRGELRLARSEQADRFILAFSFFLGF